MFGWFCWIKVPGYWTAIMGDGGRDQGLRPMVRGNEIGIAADDLGQLGRERVEHLTGRGARLDSRSRREGGQPVLEARGQLALHHPLEVLRQIGERLRVRLEARLPLAHPLLADLDGFLEVRTRFLGHPELLLGIPAERLLGQRDLVVAERPRVESLIAAQRKVEARVHENGVVHGLRPYVGSVSGVLDSMDKFRLAFEGLLQGGKPAQGVRPLSGIREAYMLLTGDFEMTGMFQRQNVGLANINTSTMADLMVEYMNKRIIRMFQEYDRFWEPLCQIEDFNNLHDIHWIVVGGIGELDVVKEGAAYTERSWTADTQTAGWVKRGNYLGLTLEAIDKDDTRRLQQAPRALAQAAWYSVGLDFTRIFTGNSGVGPVMRDSKALFHSDHGNLGTTALSLASWQATRLAMAKQKEEGSGSRLGGLTTPRYIMIPRDLEPAALTIFASEQTPGNANNDVNPDVEPGTTADARLQAARRRIIVNDFMEDANDWVAMADPRIYPNIGLGYRFGRQPELFSVADPNSGLLFSNDVLPIKVRFFYSLGPIDWRGVYKHNVE